MTQSGIAIEAVDQKDQNERHPLDAIFSARSVAIIGASEAPGSVGRTLLENLMRDSVVRKIFPVNPNHKTILGGSAYRGILQVPEAVDLAVIAVPAPLVPQVVEECGQAHVPGAIIISAGFKEHGPAGVELERQVLEHARRSGMRIIGPNCLGIMMPLTRLNATFAGAMARPGNVAFLSQSGALCTAILDWSLRELFGFSAFVSVGSMLDVGWGDLIDYFGNDPQTKSILIYMESIGDARSFLSAAREVALKKPIIVVKAGRTAPAAKAAASHTGALTGSDEVFDAAMRRAGVLRVQSISELFYMTDVLARQPLPQGPRLTIITNAGGPGVMATDALVDSRGQLAQLAPETVAALDRLLPQCWSHNNPIDILGDATPSRYEESARVAVGDPNTDGLLVILTPQAMTNPTKTASLLSRYAKTANKPILASWMGGDAVRPGESILNAAGIPTFPFPDSAARVFNYMSRHASNLEALYETPLSLVQSAGTKPQVAANIIDKADSEGRTLLDEVESKALMAAYEIPVARTEPAATADDAVRLAEAIHYPVVLKVHSRTITHKTEVGGVKLDLRDAQEVRSAFAEIQSSAIAHAGEQAFQGVTVQPMIDSRDGYELILGSSIDPQFGPVVMFGAGGQLVEVFNDRALGLPPLNVTLARRMIEQTRVFKALQGVRGRQPVDLDALSRLLVRFSQLVVEQQRIKEIDINPLLVSSERLVAVDARVLLYSPQIPRERLPRPAIRPYPTQYVDNWTMNDGTQVVIRPIRPEDEPLIVEFHKVLSEQSVRERYFHIISLNQRISHQRLIPRCFCDYDREIPLVAERYDAAARQHQILAVARLYKNILDGDAEFSLIVADGWQNHGLGTEMLKRLISVAKQERVTQIRGYIFSDNSSMQHICRKLGFALDSRIDDKTVRVSYVMDGEPD